MKPKITLYLILLIIIVSCKNDNKVNLSEIEGLQNANINLKQKHNKLNVNDSIFLIPIRVIDTVILEKYKVISFEEKFILIDSLDFYTDLLSSILSSESNISPELKKELIKKNNLALIPIFENQLKWVNKESFRNHKIENKNFELIINKNNLYLVSYIIYNDLGRYFSSYLYEDLSLKNIPVKKSTSLIIIGITEDDFFYDKIEIDKQIGKKLNLNLNLKKISFSEIHKLFEQ